MRLRAFLLPASLRATVALTACSDPTGPDHGRHVFLGGPAPNLAMSGLRLPLTPVEGPRRRRSRLMAIVRVGAGLLLLTLAQPARAAPAGAASPSGLVTPLRSYSQALREAAKTRKNVLLLFSNPHCGPCHAMEEVLFGNPAGAELVAASYVPVVLVIKLGPKDGTPETAEARATAKRFGVVHPPALLVVSRGGAKVGRLVGITRAELFGGLRHYAPFVP